MQERARQASPGGPGGHKVNAIRAHDGLDHDGLTPLSFAQARCSQSIDAEFNKIWLVLDGLNDERPGRLPRLPDDVEICQKTPIIGGANVCIVTGDVTHIPLWEFLAIRAARMV